MKAQYDVVVVGAGPAGSVAAMRAAQAGLTTLLLEKRQEIGVPVRCGEAISYVSAEPFIPLDDRWVNAYIDYFAICNSRGERVRVPPTEPTAVVDRKVFDLALARRAAEAGADVRVSSAATGLLRDASGAVSGLTVRSLGRDYRVQARLVIAADGVESQVARWAGLRTIPPLGDYYTGVQFLLSGMRGRIEPNVCEYHVGPETLAPGGYVWVFPKGEDIANVGIVTTSGGQHDGPQALLEQFVARRFPGAGILAVVVGGIPITGALKRMVADGLMVVGDAAHQADPLTAGGINLGMMGADMAVRTAVSALRVGDVSARALRPYEQAWQREYGRMHAALYAIRKVLTRMKESQFDALVSTAASLPLDRMSHAQALSTLLWNHPALLIEARTLITTGLLLK
jgi:digeranylgeranylglycerophospholipid reductase